MFALVATAFTQSMQSLPLPAVGTTGKFDKTNRTSTRGRRYTRRWLRALNTYDVAYSIE